MIPLKKIIGIGQDLYERFQKRELNFSAAGLTYYAIFSALPLVFVLVNISSVLIDQDFIQTTTTNFLSSIIDSKNVTAIQALLDNISSIEFSTSLSVAGLLLLLYGATTYIVRLNTRVGNIISIDVSNKSIVSTEINRRLIALSLSFLLIIVIFAITLLATITPLVLEYIFLGSSPLNAIMIELGSTFATAALLALFFALYYRETSGGHYSFLKTLPGGIFMATVLIVANYVFSFAVSFSITLTTFGLFSGLLAVLLWLYVFNLALLVGAVLINSADSIKSKITIPVHKL